MTLKRKDAKWEFSLHLDYNKGPNRITFTPHTAEKFFKKLQKRAIDTMTLSAKVKHLESGLVWETDDPDDLSQFIEKIVNKVGLTK
jgi:hypothetical protein